MRVFISWSGADRDVKNVIAETLSQENIPYWDSDEDCVTDFSQECIENIRRSQIYLIIVSEASMSPKSYVINELIEARQMENEGRLNILVYKVTDAPYTERFAMQLNHISDSNCVARIQKMGRAGGLDTLMRRIRYLMARRAEGMPEKPYDVLCPKVSGVPVTACGYFVKDSRNDIIASLENAFATSNLVILSNLFGFGKKSVIRRYVASHGYTSAVEIQGMHDSLQRFFLHSLHFTNLNDGAFQQPDDRSVLQTKFEFLSRLGPDHILVISDVDVEEEPDPFLLSLLRSLRCHIVLITQNSAEAYQDDFPVINVGRMETPYLLDLFFYYYDRNGYMDHEPLIPPLESFFDTIGGHTKTVEIAAAVLSREMRADPDDLVRYLGAGADDRRALTTRIVDKLSSLMVMEDFSEDVNKTLLLIALTADPVIEEAELYKLMEMCEIHRRSVLTELDNRRWITYNSRNRTVYIEPVIAQVCVSKLLNNYDVPITYFDYMAEQYNSIGSRDAITLQHHFTRLAHFARLLQLDEIAEVFNSFRLGSAFYRKDIGVIDGIVNRFTAWYDTLRSQNCDASTERVLFMLATGSWVRAHLLIPLKSAAAYPILLSLQTPQKFSMKNMGNMVSDLMRDLMDDELALGMMLGFPDEETENEADKEEPDLISFLYSQIMECLLNRDIPSMTQYFDAIIDHLQANPDYLENRAFSDDFLIVVKSVYASFSNTGAYQTGILFLEKLLTLQWPAYSLHQILLYYTKLLVNSNRPAEDAVAIMVTADDVLQELKADRSMSVELLTNTEREHAALYAYALANSGLIDEALEQFTRMQQLGVGDLLAYAVDIIDSVVNQLLFQNQSEAAVVLIDKNRGLLLSCINSDITVEDHKTRAKTLLSLGALYEERGTSDFSAGGIITDKSYYQRYSSEKKNNLLTMMTYHRVASGVRAFDFSHYTPEDFAAHTARLRSRAQAGENKMKLAPEAFALASEAGFRTLGYRHHQVQYVGAAAMLDGKISEILNGEGKTYTIALVAYVNSLYTEKCFVLDTSKYLTERNYKWMRGLFTLLGLKTGCLLPDSDPFCEDPQIVYAYFSTLGFKTLYWERGKNGPAVDLSRCSAIVDEADTVLIEHANVPVYITLAASASDQYIRKCDLAFRLAMRIKDDPLCCERSNGWPKLTPEVNPLIEQMFSISYEDISAAEELLKIERLIKKAIYCLNRVNGVDYFIQNGMIVEENERTGTMEAVDKESGYFLALANNLPVRKHEQNLCEQPDIYNLTYVYSLLKRFGTLSGTSATACSFKKEFKSIYKLDVVAIPTALPLRRADRTVTLYVSKAHKDAAIVDMVAAKHASGQPVLLIVRNVRETLHFSRLLTERNIRHNVLSAVNSDQSPDLLANAGVPGSVLIATQIANRGVDIKMGGDPERFALFELVKQGVDLSKIDRILYAVPDAEITGSDLYRSYHAALDRAHALVLSNREQVLAAGGLCVIGSEPYSDMRIEQQIRGRAGRQGAVGESYIFESMDDDLYAQILGGTKETILRMFGPDMDIISSKLLARSTENYKEKVHHRHFSLMQQAADISGRVEQSKAEFKRLTANTGSPEVVGSLLQRWSAGEENLRLVYRILHGDSCDSDSAVHRLYSKYPEQFLPDPNKAPSQFLMDAAKHHLSVVNIPEATMQELLSTILWSKWETHITAMHELESVYADQKMKNADRFYEEMYREDLERRIVEAVDLWLSAELRPRSTHITRKSAINE